MRNNRKAKKQLKKISFGFNYLFLIVTTTVSVNIKKKKKKNKKGPFLLEKQTEVCTVSSGLESATTPKLREPHKPRVQTTTSKICCLYSLQKNLCFSSSTVPTICLVKPSPWFCLLSFHNNVFSSFLFTQNPTLQPISQQTYLVRTLLSTP